MRRKRGIPLVPLVIFIALLVAIIITCVIILGTNKNKSNDTTTQNVAVQTAEPSTSPVDDETGETVDSENLINSDSDIAEAYALTGNKKTFAKYAIYSSGGFDKDSDNIRNDLKLQLAMAQVTNSDMNQESSTKSVDKDKVEEYVAKIFEDSSVELKDFSLYNSDTNFTEEYKTIGYSYNKNNATYEVQESEAEEDTPPEVTEIITRAVKYNTKMEIYVKPIFISPFYSDQISAMGCELFADYDFQSKEFPEDESVGAFSYEDYENALRTSTAQDIDGYVYDMVNQSIDLNKIAEYKYTFTKTDDGYKLKSFEKVSSSSSGDTTTDDNVVTTMSEQEKAAFNAQFETYKGEGVSVANVKLLLDLVKSSNEQYAQEADKIISVKLDNQSIDGTDSDEITNLKDSVDSSKNYTVNTTYKSRLITEITITTEEATSESE